MFNLSGSEIVVILLLALVVLGPEKLPDAIRRFGRTYGELKRMSTSFQEEMRSTIDEPMREMRETANLLREQADFTQYGDEKPKSGTPMEAGLAMSAGAQSTATGEHDLDPVLAAERDSADADEDDGRDDYDDRDLDEYEDDEEVDDDFDDVDDFDEDFDDVDDADDDFDEEPTVFGDGADGVSADEAATGDDVADTSSSEQGDSGHNTP